MPTWEVVGGVGKGGILVRTDRSLNAPKDTQRLSTGAIVKQLDTEGDRMQYLLLSGDGPSTGWVAIALQDKELLKRIPGPDLDFREGGFGYGKTLDIHCQECFEEAVDVMWCVGDGNDLQALKQVVVPDNSAGVAAPEVFSPSEPGQHAARIEMVLDKDGRKPSEDEDNLQPPAGSFVKRFDCGQETRTTLQNMPTGRTFLFSVVIEVKGKGWLRSLWIRLSTLTVDSRQPDLYNVDPFDNVRGKCKLCYCQEFVPASSWSLSSKRSIRCRKCACAADSHEISKDPAKKVSASKEDKLPVKGAEVWILALGTRGDQQPYVALGLALQRAGYKVRIFGAAPLQRFAATKGLDVTVAGKDWEEYGLELHEAALKPGYVPEWWEMPFHEMWKTSDDFMGRGVHKWMLHELPQAVKTVLMELKNQERHPDLFIYNHLGVNAGLTAWKKWGIRSVMAGLGTEPFSVTEGRTFGKKEFDVVDRSGVAPVVQETFLLWMPLEKFNNLYLEPDKLFGTSPMIKKLFTNDQLKFAKDWHYTGFWVLEKDSQVDDVAMFGGKDVMAKIERFLADRSPPVYMGWGSMTKVPGKHMLLVGIGALKALGLRGIISKGWANLSMEKLRASVSDEDPDKLCEYAEANVLFIDKAPHEWLFPRCVCTVHHGGAGTTAASLRAGVPTVITPIVYDQFEHARWVNQLGNGVGLRDLEKVETQDLEAALQKVTSSSEFCDAAREVQKLIMAEDGAQGAVDAVTLIIRDQVRNGWAKKKWEREKEQDKEDYEKWLEEEKERRKNRRKQEAALRNPEARKILKLQEDGKWLVWNSCWYGANTELQENYSGPAADEYKEKAEQDGIRATGHLDALQKESVLPLGALEHIREEAEQAGKVAARFVLEGQPLPQEEVILSFPPVQMDSEQWFNMGKAIKLAAQSVAEGCLDAKLLRNGNERWEMSPENWHLCEHHQKSQELRRQFETEWAEKVAPVKVAPEATSK